MIYIFKKNIKRILTSLIANPILIIGYWIFCYQLASLCMYGRVNNNVSILLLCIVFFIFIITFTAVKIIEDVEDEFRKSTNRNTWRYISIIIILVITSFYGVKIYKSATNYGGKLAWFISKLKNERTVEFEHNNIYKYGVGGIFADINKKYTLPEDLYMSDDFNLKFNSDGTITSFDTFVYGKDEKEKDVSYLITYDKDKSEYIILRLKGHVDADYNDDKLVEPLVETVKAIQIEKKFINWNESEYGLVYKGKRSWRYNSDGIIKLNAAGEEVPLGKVTKEIIGYTVSIFVPGKENEIEPFRYNLISDLNWNKYKGIREDNSLKEEQVDSFNNKEQFYLSKEVGYKLNVEDVALGSTFYSLSKTRDGGKTWKVINKAPFNGTIGDASGIVFINDKLGFLGASRNGGANGELYRTEDGGITFKMVSFTPHEVNLGNGHLVNIFDFPGMPYKEKEFLNVLVGQGADGDYNGNSKAVYQSKDNGVTWEFVKEIKDIK